MVNDSYLLLSVQCSNVLNWQLHDLQTTDSMAGLLLSSVDTFLP